MNTEEVQEEVQSEETEVQSEESKETEEDQEETEEVQDDQQNISGTDNDCTTIRDNEDLQTKGKTTKGKRNNSKKITNDNTTDDETEQNTTTKSARKSAGKSARKKDNKTRTRFEGVCSYCSKSFKTESTYIKHTTEQVCYKPSDVTYCKICNIRYETKLEYSKHLFSMIHINNIGCNSLEKLQTKTVASIHTADPYLSATDINKIAKSNLGDSFTFVFNKGNTQTITLSTAVNNIVNTSVNNTVNNNVIEQINTKTNTIEKTNANSLDQSNSIPKPFQPTERQTKIIKFLEQQTSIIESGKSFLKVLDNKLQLEDYKGLQRIINNLEVGNDYKQNYLKMIELFINILVKEKTKGEKLYKDKDISQLVINLTS
uniref:Uncharacterized protein n=1 Tax=viral metagenome TaxID=1070528 RepID=A0A6C0EXN1_9ZZZZ